MLRHVTFAALSLCVCSVASAQQPLFPTWNWGSVPGSTLNCPNGFCGTQPGTCTTGNCAPGQAICGPNGCYVPGAGTQWPYTPTTGGYLPPLRDRQAIPTYHTLPVYSVPSSSYPGFPNLPSSVRRDRSLPTAGGYPMFQNPLPMTGAWDQYDEYYGPGELH